MPDIAPLTPSSILFLYNFDGSTVTLEERIEIEAIAPADDGPVPAGTDLAGFWCELRDSAGTTLWRNIRRHPTLFQTDVMLDDASGGYTNVPPDGSVVAFACVVPADVPGAETVVLVGTDPLDQTGAGAAVMLTHPLVSP